MEGGKNKVHTRAAWAASRAPLLPRRQHAFHMIGMSADARTRRRTRTRSEHPLLVDDRRELSCRCVFRRPAAHSMGRPTRTFARSSDDARSHALHLSQHLRVIPLTTRRALMRHHLEVRNQRAPMFGGGSGDVSQSARSKVWASAM
jgi:hypothetical protein